MRTMAGALAAMCLGAMACRSAPRAPETCLGDEVLAVRNDTGESLDIYEVRGGTYRIIGTAGAGRTEFALPVETLHASSFSARRTRDGRWMTRAFGGRYGSSRIAIQVECVGRKVR